MPDLTAVQRPVSALPIAAKLSIRGSPDWVGIAPDAVWISNQAKNSISRIDPASNKVVATVKVRSQVRIVRSVQTALISRQLGATQRFGQQLQQVSFLLH